MKNKGLILAVAVAIGVLTAPANAASVAFSSTMISGFGIGVSDLGYTFAGWTYSSDAASDGLNGDGNADLSDAPAACVGACASFENEFYPHSLLADAAYGDAQIVNADVFSDNGAASTIAEVITGAGIAYASGANVLSGSIFNVAQDATIDFGFYASSLMYTGVDDAGGAASANTFFNITLRDGLGNKVFEWLPDGVLATGITGGMESDDPFSLNLGIASNGLYGSSGSFFSAATNALAGGTYRLNIKMENKVNAYAVAGPDVVVPLPAAAWLFIAGLTGLFATSRRKK